ncbi:nucleoside triphosphate pyrophosphohydrolase [Pseudochelatococcus contaminans]|uniref:Nucleoside triphosphate pyrophosphohydrolase n=1 Tax=Pseudochelatococcus contaminans TaxID=1538103 RepID=A0A7W5Z239_9HYPH|nr:nucleoside triphosphate pyrophosphohydrolase [Pseudochelatococcus contaminans]MBB3808646.1 ATP diphosphatase [Pseudochelatococcus contaminans]
MTPSRDISRLLEIMAALRTPETGCPWDLEQDFASIAPYTVEEAYEVADAIERNDLHDLRDELGDLLLQVVFHSRMAEEQGAFVFGDVVQAITEKLIRRHPHVFGNAQDLSPETVKILWADIKAEERRLKAERLGAEPAQAASSALDGVPRNMPALARAEKLQSKAARVGFDWTNTADVIAKIREELTEVEEALTAADKSAVREEIGDLVFAVANLARHVGVDPEAATHATNAKFTSRFNYIERHIDRTGKTMANASLGDMEMLWEEAKQLAKGSQA